VRLGYNQAIKEKKTYLGFLLLLMQRLVTSSTRAIRNTLEKRLEILQLPEDQLSLFSGGFEDEWSELDGQEQVDALLKMRVRALRNEVDEIHLLLNAAIRSESAASDAKVEALLEIIYQLQQEEADAGLKILLFTEFVPTQLMLRQSLTDRGFSVVCLNGSMDMGKRKQVLTDFAEQARILISTDAGGEGLNLQFCHIVINYDIPWNPMRLEQRIGRVDRIGQAHVVRAVNLVLEETVEYRVREVLEEKLAVILREFGVDKTGDVLDSAEASEMFDGLYKEAILDPPSVNSKVDSVLSKVRAQADGMRQSATLLEQTASLNPNEAQRLLGHPLPYWVERMTVNFLRVAGGEAHKGNGSWKLKWPDGYLVPSAVFTISDADRLPAAEHLTLEEPRIRNIANRLPRFLPEQPIPCVAIREMSSEISGTWSLWTVTVRSAHLSRERVLSLFVHNDGRVLQPTARHIWDLLLEKCPAPSHFIETDETRRLFLTVSQVAEQYGRPVYEELMHFHTLFLQRERGKKEYAFEARRRMIAQVGLTSVRQHRLEELVREESEWEHDFESRSKVQSELIPRLLISVQGLGNDG
jgi:hypothetical protein